MGKTRINADEIMRKIEERRIFNRLDLNDVEWVNDKGETITVDKKTMDDWRFTGLGNCDFVDCVLFGSFKEDTKKMEIKA